MSDQLARAAALERMLLSQEARARRRVERAQERVKAAEAELFKAEDKVARRQKRVEELMTELQAAHRQRGEGPQLPGAAGDEPEASPAVATPVAAEVLAEAAADPKPARRTRKPANTGPNGDA